MHVEHELVNLVFLIISRVGQWMVGLLEKMKLELKSAPARLKLAKNKVPLSSFQPQLPTN